MKPWNARFAWRVHQKRSNSSSAARRAQLGTKNYANRRLLRIDGTGKNYQEIYRFPAAVNFADFHPRRLRWNQCDSCNESGDV